MKKNSGFTLIELLATLTILGILMGVAVGSVFRVLDNNKKDMYVEEAKKFVSQVEYNVRAHSKSIESPELNNCIVISLGYIESMDFKKGPNGGKYITDKSFVVLKNVNNKDKFYVRLVEDLKSGNSYKGIIMSDTDDLKGGKGRNKVVTVNTSDLFVVNSSNSSKIVTALQKVGAACNSIEKIYG